MIPDGFSFLFLLSHATDVVPLPVKENSKTIDTIRSNVHRYQLQIKNTKQVVYREKNKTVIRSFLIFSLFDKTENIQMKRTRADKAILRPP